MICMRGHLWKQKPQTCAFCLMASQHSNCWGSWNGWLHGGTWWLMVISWLWSTGEIIYIYIHPAITRFFGFKVFWFSLGKMMQLFPKFPKRKPQAVLVKWSVIRTLHCFGGFLMDLNRFSPPQKTEIRRVFARISTSRPEAAQDGSRNLTGFGPEWSGSFWRLSHFCFGTCCFFYFWSR